MPQGQLFIRTKRTRALQSGAAGLITTAPTEWAVGNADASGWVDAYLRYGMSLEDGARSKLMTPAPAKSPTSASSILQDGVAFEGGSIGKANRHDFSFDVHITAPDEATFIERYTRLCEEVLEDQYFQLRISARPTKVRHLLYDGCEPFQEYNLEMAKFTLSVIEPHPEITDNRVPSIMS